jgi:chromosomal replication initiator protein
MKRDPASLPYPSVNEVVAEAAPFFRTSVAALTGRDKRRPVVWYRQATMAACRQLTIHSYAEIAWVFRRDHTTVVHAVQQAQKRTEVKRLTEALLAYLEEDRVA